MKELKKGPDPFRIVENRLFTEDLFEIIKLARVKPSWILRKQQKIYIKLMKSLTKIRLLPLIISRYKFHELR